MRIYNKCLKTVRTTLGLSIGDVMGESEKQQYDAYMSEYKVLRGEITVYSQRIDRTVGIYLSALFGLFGFLLRPDSSFSLPQYLTNIQSSTTLVGVFLIIGVLNCLLVVRIQSFYLAVLAMSQYTATIITPKVSQLLGIAVLNWDEPDVTRAKKYWLPVRSVAQGGFGLLAIAVSLFIAIATFSSVTSSFWLTLLYVLLWVSITYVCFVLYRIVLAGRNFHEIPALLCLAQESKH